MSHPPVRRNYTSPYGFTAAPQQSYTIIHSTYATVPGSVAPNYLVSTSIPPHPLPRRSITLPPHYFTAADLTSFVHNVSRLPVTHGGPTDIYDGSYLRRDGQMIKVALKVHRVVGSPSAKLIKHLNREITVWASIDNPFIQPFFGLYWGMGRELPALVSPWCDNGDINTYLERQKSRLPEEALEALKLDLLINVLEGLRHLHEKGIVHADIKGGNVLVSNDAVARLSDFGFSAILAEHRTSSTTVKGTIRWMSPELFADDNARHTRKSDIWACGCLLLEILSGRVPYHNIRKNPGVIKALGNYEQPRRPPNLSDPFWQLINACCDPSPDMRPLAAFVCQRLRLIRLIKDLNEDKPLHATDAESLLDLLRERANRQELFDVKESNGLESLCRKAPRYAAQLLTPTQPRMPGGWLSETMRLCMRTGDNDSEEDPFLMPCIDALMAAFAIVPHRGEFSPLEIAEFYVVLGRRDPARASELLRLCAHGVDRTTSGQYAYQYQFQ
ncbi:kinase-like protein [Exidia glandulosa HHB12029]|uniref:Kinase-like protein n=1 Tax=Exidia glandulosa HHB12029 TaxID=1314781 RepID=A0A165LT78_EXIGL|nr:kinase-like protein [Exidia glandulosa HHB12029]